MELKVKVKLFCMDNATVLLCKDKILKKPALKS
jgi:hypothetical protein